MALRSVLKVDWSFSSSDLFWVLKVDNLSDRRDKHVLHMMYKIAHELTPGDFLKYFTPKEYHYGLRNARKCFEIPKPHTNFKSLRKEHFLTGELKIRIKYPSKQRRWHTQLLKGMSSWPVYKMKRYKSWLFCNYYWLEYYIVYKA